MSSFTNAVFEVTEETRYGKPLYRIVGGFRYYIGHVGSSTYIDVPDGFLTDGPSMPAWLAKIIPAQTLVKSSAVHDYLRENLRYSKPEGDAIFLTAMYAEGTPAWLRELAFIAVRLDNHRLRAK
ncbi:MAG: DUF1353 domain-containing protein [Oxalobacteraceae bacterium]|jgi:hypothetical protein|nr:MAG: DUF1353 domain-containing protein [Oxalobacteraceae bacterium]